MKKHTKAPCPACLQDLPVLAGRRLCCFCGSAIAQAGDAFELAACPPIETKAELEARRAAVGEAMRHA